MIIHYRLHTTNDAAKVGHFHFFFPSLPVPFLPRCTQKGTIDGTMVAGLALRIQAILLPTLLRNSSPSMWLVQAATDAGTLRSAAHDIAVPIGCTEPNQEPCVQERSPSNSKENVCDLKPAVSVVRN